MTMRERGRVQLQFMKTRSSSAVGTKIELEFNTTSLRITDLDENSADAPTTADVLYNNLQRKSSQQDSTPPKSGTWERATGTPAWEKPAQKQEPSVGIRTMDSMNKVKDLLKKS
jgi:hypothetical protein